MVSIHSLSHSRHDEHADYIYNKNNSQLCEQRRPVERNAQKSRLKSAAENAYATDAEKSSERSFCLSIRRQRINSQLFGHRSAITEMNVAAVCWVSDVCYNVGCKLPHCVCVCVCRYLWCIGRLCSSLLGLFGHEMVELHVEWSREKRLFLFATITCLDYGVFKCLCGINTKSHAVTSQKWLAIKSGRRQVYLVARNLAPCPVCVRQIDWCWIKPLQECYL